MTRLMYDAVTASNIPTDAVMVAGYIDPDGDFTWSGADWARFPNAVKVRIAGHPWTNDGHVLDVEAGDATPNEAPAWVVMRRKAGLSQPTVYCSESVWEQCKNAFIAANVAMPEWWIAAYPGIGPILYDGSVAHQYANVGPYDLSIVADYWPGVDTNSEGFLMALSDDEQNEILEYVRWLKNGTFITPPLLTILTEIWKAVGTLDLVHGTEAINIMVAKIRNKVGA